MMPFKFLLFFSCVLSLGLVLPQADAEDPTADATPLAQKLFDRCSPSIVTIVSQDRDGEERGIGTGFVFGDRGYIATNLHVIDRSRSFQVQTQAGKTLTAKSIHAFDGGLDLVIIEVEPHDLPSLDLAEPKSSRTGENVVVLGNPQGLKHSVVAGVLSGRREIDGRDMLQLAIPIEQGNSGGPVLNQHGQVLGIVTMKSAVTENLGFAVAVEHLRQLIEEPNPVTYDRWLTLGVLDPSAWQPLFGGKWTQRGGKIFVAERGQGFGGRALCLKRELPDTLPYEASVLVNMNELDGAAGLAFLADGHSRHYGVYPSSGQIRVTRFDGPTVYQWTVLEEKEIPGLGPETWVHLKVRIDDEKLTCYANDQRIYQGRYDKQRYRPKSQVGLVKFRHTTAQFKNLELGKTLPNFSPHPDQLQAWQESFSIETQAADITSKKLSQLAENAELARFALRKKARQLRQQAEQLEKISRDIHTASVLDRLRTMLDDAPLDVFDAGMAIASLDDVELTTTPYRQQLDAMAKQLKEQIPNDADAETKLKTLHRFMFDENGFHGSRSEYYHRGNSYLSRVLDDREGIPVSLSIVYLELATAVGLKAEGIGMPGHFLVQLQLADDKRQLIDVFEKGKRIDRTQARRQSEEIIGDAITETDFAPVDDRQMLVRLLVNLVNIAQRENDWEGLLRYYQALVVIEPDSSQFQGMLALLLHQTGRTAAALEQLDWLDANMSAKIGEDRLRQMRLYFEQGS